MEVLTMRSDLVTGVELLLADGQPLILQVNIWSSVELEVAAIRCDLVTGVELMLAEGQPLILQVKIWTTMERRW